MRVPLLFATGLCWIGAVATPQASAVPPFHMRFTPPQFHHGFRAFVPTNNFRFPNAVPRSTTALNNFITLSNFQAVQPLNNQLLANRAFNNLLRGVAPNNINNFAQLPHNPIPNGIQPAAGTTAYINNSANPYWPNVNPWRTVPTGWNWPYYYSGYPYAASYGYPSSYYSPGYSGYGGGGYGGGGYGGGYGGGGYGGAAGYSGGIPAYNPYSAYADTGATAAPAKSNPVPTLTAFAIPNEDGRVKWPLAFRLMNPDQKKDMLDKLEAQLQIVTAQAAGGQANPRLVEQANQSVEKLEQWLRNRRDQLAGGTVRDGEAFLRKLENALKAMGG